MFCGMEKNRIRFRALGWTMALAATLLTSPAWCQDSAVTLNYDIELAGTFGFRVQTTLRLADDRYAIDADVRKQGILGAVTQSFHAQVNSRGKVGVNVLNVAASDGRLQAGDEDRRFSYVYGPDGQLTYDSKPELDVKTGREVTDEQRRGSLDPLSAAIAAFVSRPDPCVGPVAVFDGRRRFDLVVEPKGMERVPDGDSVGVKDKGVRCDVRLHRIAGYKPGADSDTELTRPARLWLAKLDDSGRLYPVRLEIDIGIGEVVAHLTKFNARPLTADEKAALAK
jgi:hypothetical protein